MVSRGPASLRTDTAGTRRSIRATLIGRSRAMEQAVNARRERSEPPQPDRRTVRHTPACPQARRADSRTLPTPRSERRRPRAAFWLASEIRFADLGVGGEGGGRAFEDDSAGLEDIAVARD